MIVEFTSPWKTLISPAALIHTLLSQKSRVFSCKYTKYLLFLDKRLGNDCFFFRKNHNVCDKYALLCRFTIYNDVLSYSIISSELNSVLFLLQVYKSEKWREKAPSFGLEIIFTIDAPYRRYK